jgi:hypothetical protein
MHVTAYPVPSEQHDAEEAGLQKEGGHDLEGHERGDDIAGRLRKAGEISAEFKFQYDPGDDSDTEIDSKELHPKTIHAVIQFFLRLDPQKLNDYKKDGEAYGQRGEENVEKGRDGKLNS